MHQNPPSVHTEKWRIIGAEAATGEERSIEVNARDEAGAREAARMLGMLVATVERLAPPQGPVLDYRPPGLTNRPASVAIAEEATAETTDSPAAADHAAILHAARATLEIAKLLFRLGMLALVLAAAAGSAAGLSVVMQAERREYLFVPLVLLALGCVGGVGLIVLAVVLQLLAAIGLAVRDIAKRDRERRDEPG